jgi:hypothetical protein
MFSSRNILQSLVLMSGLWVGCEEPKINEIYRLPEGFKGWIMVKFAFKECPPITHENGVPVISVPPSGIICTSDGSDMGVDAAKKQGGRFSSLPRFYVGSSKDPLFYTLQPGKGGYVWDGGQGWYGEKPSEHMYLTFFIGTETEYLAAMNSPQNTRLEFIRRNQ